MAESFSDELMARTVMSNGPTVLWLHGYTMDSSLWRGQWDELNEYSHIGLDLPGHGASPTPVVGNRLDDFARVLGCECIRRDIRHIVGLSFGSAIAMQLCAEFPDYFHTVVLGAPTLLGIDDDPETKRVYIELGRLFQTMGSGPWLSDYWLANSHMLFEWAKRRSELWVELQRVIRAHAWSEFRTNFMRRLVAYNQLSRLASLRALKTSVLVVTGKHETQSSLAAARALENVVACYRWETVPNAGHLCLIEDPQATSILIREHIERGARQHADK